jgi:type I restriction enzyme S subunit
MNAERLLAHYERIAGAPDAIARLRSFILNLAVRGKLVLQDPKEEPASELLKRIAKERARREKTRTLREQKSLPQISAEDIDFAICKGWQWVRLGDVIKLWNGFAFKSGDFQSEGVPVIRIGDLQGGVIELSNAVYVSNATAKTVGPEVWIPPDALLIAMSGATTGKTAFNRAGIPLLLNQRVGRIEVFSGNVNYIRCFFETIVNRNLSISFGTAIPNLSIVQINETVIALPPLAEQHRIVAKVDELMALCDRLEAARAEREAARDRLAASTLARLNTPDPATFQTDARFALNTIPALTTRPDQIKQLRQTILNLAVRGKLVPQDKKDEPASKLLARLKKAQTVAYSGEGLRSRPPVIKLTRAEMWFEFPESWSLSSFDDLFVIVSGVTKGQKIGANEAVDAPYLRVANVQRGHLDLAIIKNITVRRADVERYSLLQGDILMTEGGDWDKLGRAAIWHEEIPGCIHQNHIFRVRPPSEEISSKWVTIYVNSLLGRRFFEDASKQTTNLASINMTQLRGCPFPLPPFAEQHRIVAKVDALMKICDQLEASLDQTASTRRNLLDALLAEAISPTATRELEAAE